MISWIFQLVIWINSGIKVSLSKRVCNLTAHLNFLYLAQLKTDKVSSIKEASKENTLKSNLAFFYNSRIFIWERSL